MPRIVAILPAAGFGTRMGQESPKQFRLLDGLPLIVFTLRRLARCSAISEFLVATRGDEVPGLAARLAEERLGRPVEVVRGGDSRQESVANALAKVPPDAQLVLVHDAVRPLVTCEQVERVIAEAAACRAAILGIPALDTLKEVTRANLPGDVALILTTIPRERVVLAQTPQVFDAALLRDAFARAQADGVSASDEAGLVERLGVDVHVVLGSERNLKITRPGDLELAEFYLSQERKQLQAGPAQAGSMTRSGIGYDLHRLAEGRKLLLGGIEVPFDKGPVGHSDGDALAHAICDALLGAAGLGDIGTHFPDSDPRWKDASSLVFLEQVRAMLDEKGLRIAHIDATVIAERPKLVPHFPAMRQALSAALKIEPLHINLKAKTNEGVDAVGRGEAIAAQAIATLED